MKEEVNKEVKENISKENRKWSRKLGTSPLTSVNVSRSIPDIIGTKSIMDDESNLTIMVNRSRNHITTGTTTLVAERKWPGDSYGSRLGYKRAVKNPRPHLHSSFSTCSFAFYLCFPMFLRKRMVSCFSFRSTIVGLLGPLV